MAVGIALLAVLVGMIVVLLVRSRSRRSGDHRPP
jgi:hypothetical protein